MKSHRRPLTFYKMHSLGNDFMVIDAVTQSVLFDEQQVAQWGDRHTGIGFDQLLVIEPPTQPDADFYYRVYNADGSLAEQCGNGTRCVATLAKKLGLTKQDQLTWQSAAGTFTTSIENAEQVETTMTVPVLTLADIPFNPEHAHQIDDAAATTFRLRSEEQTYDVTPVSMGNPHAVIFVKDIFNVDVDKIGGELTEHPSFPERANVGFCQIIDQQFMRLRVYERGTGETQACGSGACAAVVAARLHNHVSERVKVSLPGGKLRITWPGPASTVTMQGPASLVFRGEVQLQT